jgi:hypothetical protein
MAQSFRVLRKFCSGPQPLKTRICSRQDAKNAKFGIGFPFATFASLREIFPTFGCGFAALGPSW